MTTVTAQHAPAHDLDIDLDADPFEDLDYEDQLHGPLRPDSVARRPLRVGGGDRRV